MPKNRPLTDDEFDTIFEWHRDCELAGHLGDVPPEVPEDISHRFTDEEVNQRSSKHKEQRTSGDDRARRTGL